MSKELLENHKEIFKGLVERHIQRAGIDELMNWLETTDFYTAPASTRYHGNCEGGLLFHSLNVYFELKKLCKIYTCNASEESMAIVALFHDLCKIGCYKQGKRWRKNKHQQWEQYDTWEFQEDFPYGGHGSKSVFIVQSFMKLGSEEASAINCHMGQWDATQYSNPTPVFENNLLAWLLHVADEAADFLDEKREENKHE